MQRRALVTLAGAAIVVVSPLCLRAQQPALIGPIGFQLPFNNENDGPVRQLLPSCDDWLNLAIRIIVLRLTSIVF
jgi:hypothetical protein